MYFDGVRFEKIIKPPNIDSNLNAMRLNNSIIIVNNPIVTKLPPIP